MGISKGSKPDHISCSVSMAVGRTSISGSSNNSKVTLYRYSPENIPQEILENIFVGRDDLFEKTFKELETAGKNKTPRFYLIVGSRGIGKSHFLIMLYHKIKQELSSLYIPVKFAEEEYSVYRASDFFLRVLQEQNEDTSGILSLNDEDEILDASLDRLKEIAKKENKTYLIFVENLHEVFRQFEAKEVQKLRSIFQKYDFFSIVASSPIIFPGVAESEEPFYNFFRIQYLRELTVNEIKILLKKIAKNEDNSEFLKDFNKYESRIEGIAHLTGGSPRLVIFFYELIARDNFEDLEKAFFKILDEHTPYYQEIFQLLTGQKRLIFDTVISSESPLTPKQIAEKSRIDASTVITQLRRLEKDGYVLSRPMGRETYYEVRERLFRLWRDMRQPLGRNRISVFMDFLKLWYTSDEQKELFERKFHLLESGNKDVLKDLCYYVEVLPDKYKTEALLRLTPKIIELEEWEEVDYDTQKLKEIANKNADINLKAKSLIFESLSHYKYDKIALETFKKALKFNQKDYFVLLDSSHITIYKELLRAFDKILDLNPEDEYALSRKGYILGSLKRYEEALEVFNHVLDLNPEDEYALSDKGNALNLLGRYEEALEVFNKVLNLNPENEYALSNKGNALGSLKRYEEALEVFNHVLDLNPENESALSDKGYALGSLKKHEDALEIFNHVLDLNPEDESALSNKGNALNLLGRYEEALEVFNHVLDLNPEDEYALSRKGYALDSLKRYEEALEVFNKVLDLNPEDEYALSRKGYALGSLKKHEEALEVFNHVLDLNPENESALSNKGNALNLLGRYEEALEVFNKVLDLNSENEYALLRKGNALNLLGRYEEALEVFNKVLDLNPENESALSNKGYILGSLKRYEEALEVFNNVLDLNPEDESALSNKGYTLGSLKRYEEAIEIFVKVKNITSNESLRIESILDLIETYLSLDQVSGAITEIEPIKSKISYQAPRLIEKFIDICWKIVFKELRTGNLGSGRKYITVIFDLEPQLDKETFGASMMNFCKTAVDSGELEILKIAIGEILKLKVDNYPELLKPLVKAVEIIETKDIQKYYKLQVEEREIVADIVQKISKSGDLLP
ncbi:tetratricopeptide repeat protein [Methanosarcina barkeri]|uniref:TPR repeat-containing protein n=1 Tax=Methanosarcina barkeri CM1 TaxID=796385 RepID=A0A0G3CIL3_METBA|nr:tetratricopeptide repeat protein [Methanosarcina barkeri]AKJ40590.1 TPR repeat-containing protein [Methanosarcina barkeri CM1]